MAVILVSLPVSGSFQTESLAEIRGMKKCSFLILYGKTQRATGEILGSLKAGENSWAENKSLGQGEHHFQHD